MSPIVALGHAHILTRFRHARESGYPVAMYQAYCRVALGLPLRGATNKPLKFPEFWRCVHALALSRGVSVFERCKGG